MTRRGTKRSQRSPATTSCPASTAPRAIPGEGSTRTPWVRTTGVDSPTATKPGSCGSPARTANRDNPQAPAFSPASPPTCSKNSRSPTTATPWRSAPEPATSPHCCATALARATSPASTSTPNWSTRPADSSPSWDTHQRWPPPTEPTAIPTTPPTTVSSAPPQWKNPTDLDQPNPARWAHRHPTAQRHRCHRRPQRPPRHGTIPAHPHQGSTTTANSHPRPTGTPAITPHQQRHAGSQEPDTCSRPLRRQLPLPPRPRPPRHRIRRPRPTRHPHRTPPRRLNCPDKSYRPHPATRPPSTLRRHRLHPRDLAYHRTSPPGSIPAHHLPAESHHLAR